MDDATRRQLFRFIVAGVAATLLDATVYFGLVHAVLDGGHDVAKACSFLAGTTVSFLVNKLWTFESKERSARELGAFVALYAATFGLNVGTNRLVLTLFTGGWVEPFGWLAATGASTVANFIGQKFWVFRAQA